MSDILLSLTVVAAAIGLGGGLYEFSVVDPSWPNRIDIIQPQRGGISRRRFWIPAHVIFELLLVASLVVAWGTPEVRFWLLIALASHAIMRVWSAFDFIPKALAFERAEASPRAAEEARKWIGRSRLRFPLDVATCGATVMAMWAAAGGGAG